MTSHPERIAPMLLTEVAEAELGRYDTDSDWVYEQKCDGIRCSLHVLGGTVVALNRSGQRPGTTLPKAMVGVVEAAGATHGVDFVLDGELVGTRGAKRLWLFDLPWLTRPDGSALIEPASPYHKRRLWLGALHDTLGLAAGGIELLPQATRTEAKVALRARLLAGGAEGVVVKHLDAPYLPGRRSPRNLKAKYWKTVDCFVRGVGYGGRDNLGLGVYGPDGGVVDVGEITAHNGDGPRISRMWEPGRDIVVEVRCLYATADNRLYQPTVPRLRVDKPAAECTLDQLDIIRGAKTVLPA